jgi:hypothetical protein
MRDPFISEGWSEKLHVVTAISNPVNYISRYELYVEFEKRMKDAGVILWTVELAYGERSFVVTKPDNPFHLQLRVGGEDRKGNVIWSKENLLNLMIQRIPKEGKYIAWIDADIIFQRPDWAEETIQQLQIHDFIQPWSHAQDMDPDGAPLNKKPEISFCYAWYNDMEMEWNHKKYSSGTGHPGYAWAARREALDKVGGLIDFAVLGSGDRHMAYGLVDKIEFSVHPNVHPNYLKHLKYWQVRARHYIHRNIGYLPGMITHHWHGSKKSRGYKDRWQILVNNQYNPELDLKKTTQGVNVLTERNWKLRHDIIRYFESRSEDDIHVD